MLGRRTSTASPLTNKTKGNSCATTNNPTNEALSSLESALTQSAPVTPLESALTIYMGGWGTPSIHVHSVHQARVSDIPARAMLTLELAMNAQVTSSSVITYQPSSNSIYVSSAVTEQEMDVCAKNHCF